MIFRNLDKNGDFTFGKGKNNFVADNEAIKLDIKTRLQEWLGDCFFNMTAGIDYLNRLDKNERENLEEEIRTVILQTKNVVEIVNFSTSLINRKFKAEYQVRTIFSKAFIDRIEVSA